MSFPIVSFEVIPRYTDAGLKRVRETVEEGLKFNPAFIDLSFGGGGKTDDDGKISLAYARTIAAIREQSSSVLILPHYTGNGLTKRATTRAIRENADNAHGAVLIGGDKRTLKNPGNYYISTEKLIAGVAWDFNELGLLDKANIYVAVSLDVPGDIARLTGKFAKGEITGSGLKRHSMVKGAISQSYTRLELLAKGMKQAARLGIPIPIIPGIPTSQGRPEVAHAIPLPDGAELKMDRFGVVLHPEYLQLFEGVEDSRLENIHRLFMGSQLYEAKVLGVPHIHGYTHNRPDFFETVKAVYPGIADSPAPRDARYSPMAATSALQIA